MKRIALTLALVALALVVSPPAAVAQTTQTGTTANPPPQGTPDWYRAVIAATDFNCDNYADDYEAKIQHALQAAEDGDWDEYDTTLIEMSVIAAGMMNQVYSCLGGAWVPLLDADEATLQQALNWIDAKKEMVQEMLDASKGLRDYFDDTTFDWQIADNIVEYWELQLKWLDDWKESLTEDFGPPVVEEETVPPTA